MKFVSSGHPSRLEDIRVMPTVEADESQDIRPRASWIDSGKA